jgi:hypothetical protein
VLRFRSALRVFLLAVGLGLAAPGCGAALPSAGADSVPDSGGEEPPIRALIRVGLAARSDCRSCRRSLPESVAIPARWCGRLGAPGGGVAGLRFLAVLRTGWKGDTPPLKGCCTVTCGYRARTC